VTQKTKQNRTLKKKQTLFASSITWSQRSRFTCDRAHGFLQKNKTFSVSYYFYLLWGEEVSFISITSPFVV